MKELFDKRRQDFHSKIIKYLPYVFNDHFVLVLLVGLGFVLYQYRLLLNNLPRPSLLYLGLAVYGLFLLSLGRVATYLEAADSHFLLPKEEAVRGHFKTAKQRAVLFWNLVTTLLWLAPLPLFLALDGLIYFLLGYLLLHLGKWLTLAVKSRDFLLDGQVNWSVAIAKEENRQQSILKFFSLFTTVKGLKSTAKPRTYLDGLLRYVPKGQKNFYLNLYARAFLRKGDYLELYLRLVGLTWLVMVGVGQPYLAAGAGVLGQFLWQFQLLSLYRHYDYQYLLNLAPIDQKLKADNLLTFLRLLSLPSLLVSLVLAGSWQAGVLLLAGAFLLNFIYLPQKIKAMID